MLRAWPDPSARRRYRQFVLEGMGGTALWAELRQQIYLGDERFVERMPRKTEIQGDELSIPRAQRSAYSYRKFAEHFQLHLATVGRIIRARTLQFET